MQHQITLQPVGTTLTAEHGSLLKELLFEHSVEFPCGGQGRCRGCRVRITSGHMAINDAQRERLSESELAEGWRLACQCRIEGEITLELRQWDASILTNDSDFQFTPQEGLGVAVDIGTTTVVAQLLDMQTGAVLAVRTGLNPQARYGGDVMSRVQYAVAEQGAGTLQDAITRQVGALLHQLVSIANVDAARIRRVVLAGNTVMHHLFCGIDLEPLSHYPFEPVDDGLQRLTAEQIHWDIGIAPNAVIEFLPCMGSFVGSDILAGVLATGMHTQEAVSLLVDLGTNGEIVLGNRERLLCASTAAGPAFEGARISMGMRAATGAIWKVLKPTEDSGDAPICEVLGSGVPTGLCGSGLVDAVAVGLDMGRIKPSGRFAGCTTLDLLSPVTITQTDIRELQLAKGAIAAGIRILLNRWGISAESLEHIYLAGAFGNYIDRHSARRIGLLDFDPDRVQPVGNSALLGAKIALFTAAETVADGQESGNSEQNDIIGRTTHISLTSDPAFQDIYVDCMGFPA